MSQPPEGWGDKDAQLREAVDLLLKLVSKTDLEEGDHVSCLLLEEVEGGKVEAEEQAYPAVIMQKKAKHQPGQDKTGDNAFKVKFMDDGGTTWANTSVVDHPLLYSLDTTLDEFFDDERLTNPEDYPRVVRLFIELPDVSLACRVFFVTKKKKLCTEKEIFEVASSDGLQIPMPTISHFTYRIQDQKWFKQSRSGRAQKQPEHYNPSLSTTQKYNTSSMPPSNDTSPKKTKARENNKSQKSPNKSSSKSPKKECSKKKKHESPQGGGNSPKKHKSQASEDNIMLNMKKVATFLEYALKCNKDLTFEDAIHKLPIGDVLSDSGNQSIEQLFKKLKQGMDK